MALSAGLALVVTAIVELFVIVQVVHVVGVVPTIALLLVVPLLGVRVCKRQGLAVLRRVRQQVQAGQMPGAPLLEGLWVLVAGVLLIVPGFVTDVIALLLLTSPVRRVANRLLRARLGGRVVSITPFR
jgi:UPF0716 protein FxsA